MDLSNVEKGVNLKDLNLNISLVNILYIQYKEFIIPIVAIIVSIILVVIIVIPQTQGLLQNQEELKKEQEKLTVLKNNYNLLVNMDEAQVTSNLQSLTKALPPNKDFVGVINTISYNSVRSNIFIEDFEFLVGDISKQPKESSDFPFLTLKLSLSGSAESVINFISELYKSIPMAEVIDIKSTSENSTVTVLFYYKTFSQGSVTSDFPLTELTKKEQGIIDDISSWNDTSGELFLPIVGSTEGEASPSATTNSGPF